MTQIKRIGLRAIAFTTVCAVFAAHVRGDEGLAIPPAAGIALHDGGALYGHLLDAQKRPLANREVRILSKGRLVIAVKTNARGQFAVRGLRAGVHTLEATNSSQTVALWAPRTAPPAADRVAVLVAGQESIGPNAIIRAQLNGNGENYGPAIKGGIAGALLGAGTYWALDYNPTGS